MLVVRYESAVSRQSEGASGDDSATLNGGLPGGGNVMLAESDKEPRGPLNPLSRQRLT
jgi:hypothetical protein